MYMYPECSGRVTCFGKYLTEHLRNDTLSIVQKKQRGDIKMVYRLIVIIVGIVVCGTVSGEPLSDKLERETKNVSDNVLNKTDSPKKHSSKAVDDVSRNLLNKPEPKKTPEQESWEVTRNVLDKTENPQSTPEALSKEATRNNQAESKNPRNDPENETKRVSENVLNKTDEPVAPSKTAAKKGRVKTNHSENSSKETATKVSGSD